MSELKGEISRRQLLKLASPLGKVRLDRDRCTGCGLCALDCPSGALAIMPDEEMATYRLLFKHHLCFACNRCVEVCPEQCLRLERTLEPDSLRQAAAVLFKDEFVRCAGCGVPFASRAMINSIRAKVGTSGRFPASGFDFCPECKTRVQFGQMRN